MNIFRNGDNLYQSNKNIVLPENEVYHFPSTWFGFTFCGCSHVLC